MIFFAHEGHIHETVTLDIWSNFIINAWPFALLIAIVVFARFVLRASTKTQVTLALIGLLAIGLIGYRWAPVASTIALVVGFGVSLALMVMPNKTTR